MKQTILSTTIALLFSTSATADAPFSVSPDGHEVADSVTSLVWRRCAEGMQWNGLSCSGRALTFTHDSAITRAKAQSLVTGAGWRVPSLKELLSIADPTRLLVSAVDATVFSNLPPQRFWTSTTFARDTPTNTTERHHAQYVDFSSGGYLHAPSATPHSLILVRDKR